MDDPELAAARERPLAERATAVPADAPAPRPSSPLELFVSFSAMALQGFGGVLPIAQRAICERKRWLTRQEFLETFALSQVLPGPNICNLALILGDRYFGVRGATAALGGLFAGPLVIVIALAAFYEHFASVPAVAGALKGMGAVAAGLIGGMALKLASGLRGNAMGVAACTVFAIATFALVGVLRVPLIWALFGIGPLACAWAWRRLGRTSARGDGK